MAQYINKKEVEDILKRLWKKDNDKGLTMFSDLNKNLDKRVKESLISFLKSPFIRKNITPMHVAPWINWLEKSDDKKYVSIDEVVDLLDRELVNDKDEVTNEPSIKFANNFQFKEIFISIFKQKLLEDAYRKETKNDILSLSPEKNKKETDNINFINCDDTTHTEEDIFSENEEICNFKVDDWIVDKNCKIVDFLNTPKERILHILSCNADGSYICESYDNYLRSSYFSKKTIEKYKLWTIEDAMPGDIIVNGSTIIMFALINFKTVNVYCYVSNDIFYDDSDGSSGYYETIDSDFRPADLNEKRYFYKKMADAGYAWTHRNLVKIKVSSLFNIGDWIINNENGNTLRVLQVSDTNYKVSTLEGEQKDISKIIINNNYHKFTLRDLKPGDVIVDDENNIGIFESIGHGEHGSFNDDTYCYCFGILYEGEYFYTDDVIMYDYDGVHPASKEEQERLFDKILNSGYDWDYKNKKLIYKR